MKVTSLTLKILHVANFTIKMSSEPITKKRIRLPRCTGSSAQLLFACNHVFSRKAPLHHSKIMILSLILACQGNNGTHHIIVKSLFLLCMWATSLF